MGSGLTGQHSEAWIMSKPPSALQDTAAIEIILISATINQIAYGSSNHLV